MEIADFDAWRDRYDSMAYADMQAFYDRIESEHPVQAGYNIEAYAYFLTHVALEIPSISVLEFGGWKGELAQAMFERIASISAWSNTEICQGAIRKTVVNSIKYTTWLPGNFVWAVALPPLNVMVAAHFIEHIRAAQLEALFDNLPPTIQFIGLQAPIADSAENHDWTGYHGAHILEIGWQQVGELLAVRGYQEVETLRNDEGIGGFRAYGR